MRSSGVPSCTSGDVRGGGRSVSGGGMDPNTGECTNSTTGALCVSVSRTVGVGGWWGPPAALLGVIPSWEGREACRLWVGPVRLLRRGGTTGVGPLGGGVGVGFWGGPPAPPAPTTGVFGFSSRLTGGTVCESGEDRRELLEFAVRFRSRCFNSSAASVPNAPGIATGVTGFCVRAGARFSTDGDTEASSAFGGSAADTIADFPREPRLTDAGLLSMEGELTGKSCFGIDIDRGGSNVGSGLINDARGELTGLSHVVVFVLGL